MFLNGKQLLEGGLAGLVDGLFEVFAELVAAIRAGVDFGLEGSFKAAEADVVLAGQRDRLLQEAKADDAAKDLLDVVEPSLLVTVEIHAGLPQSSVLGGSGQYLTTL